MLLPNSGTTRVNEEVNKYFSKDGVQIFLGKDKE